MYRDGDVRSEHYSPTDDHDTDDGVPPRHSPARQCAPGRGVGGYDSDNGVPQQCSPARQGVPGGGVSESDALRTVHPADSMTHSNINVVGMSLCTVDVADGSYRELPTPSGSGNRNANRGRDREYPTRSVHERQYATFEDGLLVRQLGGDLFPRRNLDPTRTDPRSSDKSRAYPCFPDLDGAVYSRDGRLLSSGGPADRADPLRGASHRTHPLAERRRRNDLDSHFGVDDRPSSVQSNAHGGANPSRRFENEGRMRVPTHGRL